MILVIMYTLEKRINLLNNVMKRINTDHKTGILIKDGSGKFIKIDNYGLNVIFDTGNASITLISENIVPILGLKQKKGFTSKVIGVGGSELTYDSYVDLELKFIPDNTNIDIQNTYKIKAYIDNKSSNRILLGQSSESLKLFFDNSYCIGYDGDKQKYMIEYENKIKKYKIEYKILEELYESLITGSAKIKDDLVNLMKSNEELKFDYVNNLYDEQKIDKEEKIYNLIQNIIKLIKLQKNQIHIDLFFDAKTVNRSKIDKITFIEKLKKII